MNMLNNNFDNVADKLDNLAAELEQELSKDFNKKETFMNTLLKNASEEKKVLPFGAYKGASLKEATAKVMEKNAALPTALLSNESNEAKDKLITYLNRKAELIAEHEVRVESISSVYDHKIDTNTAMIKDMLDKIKILETHIGELTQMNAKLMQEKQNRIEMESGKTDEQIKHVDQIISSIRVLIENLSVSVN